MGYGYCTALDVQCTVAGGLTSYVKNVTYTAYGQVAEVYLGSTVDYDVKDAYDPDTGALTDQQVIDAAVSATPIDDTSYDYDASGNITDQTEVRQGTASETQCFDYDQLDRLTQAWTTSSAGSCATNPQTDGGATVGDGISGSAYWSATATTRSASASRRPTMR